MDLVSIVITVYKRLELAQRAVESALAQTYKNIEVIVVEDGSDCGIEAWLREKEDLRLQYVRHPQNRGLAAARNTGLSHAKGKYFAILDDDDYWLPHKLDRQLKKIKNLPPKWKENLGFVSCWIWVENVSNKRLVNAPLKPGRLREQLVRPGPQTPSSSLLFLTSNLRKIGGFDENLKSSIDHDIWMKCAKADLYTDFIEEGLCIVEERTFRNTMMTQTTKRIDGVRQFVSKWKPFWENELGAREGQDFADRYFLKVIGKLAVLKFSSRSWAECLYALRSIGLRQCFSPYGFIFLGKNFIKAFLKMILPNRIHYIFQKSSGRNSASLFSASMG